MADKLKLDKSMAMYAEAQTLVPGAVAGIRRPYNFVQGEYPIYFDSGKGGRVTDVTATNTLIICALMAPSSWVTVRKRLIERCRNKCLVKGFASRSHSRSKVLW